MLDFLERRWNEMAWCVMEMNGLILACFVFDAIIAGVVITSPEASFFTISAIVAVNLGFTMWCAKSEYERNLARQDYMEQLTRGYLDPWNSEDKGDQ